MSAVTWKEHRAYEWIASNNLGRVVGKVNKNTYDSLYTVNEPPNAVGEYTSLEYAKAAVERAAKESLT